MFESLNSRLHHMYFSSFPRGSKSSVKLLQVQLTIVTYLIILDEIQHNIFYPNWKYMHSLTDADNP